MNKTLLLSAFSLALSSFAAAQSSYTGLVEAPAGTVFKNVVNTQDYGNVTPTTASITFPEAIDLSEFRLEIGQMYNEVTLNFTFEGGGEVTGVLKENHFSFSNTTNYLNPVDLTVIDSTTLTAVASSENGQGDIVLASFSGSGAIASVSLSKPVEGSDRVFFYAGKAAAPVPEASSSALLGLAGISLLLHRKR